MKLPGIFTRNSKYQGDVSFVLPSSIAASIIFFAIILGELFGIYPEVGKRLILISIGVGGSIYVILQTYLIAPRIQSYRTLYIWVNAVISGLGLSLLAISLDKTHHTFFDILLILSVTSIAIFSGRGPTYLLIIGSETANIVIHKEFLTGF